jgi:hypothetical protein
MKLNVDKLRQMFPKASADFIEANAADLDAQPQPAQPETKPRGGPKPPTKTEAEFGLMLEMQRSRGEVLDFKFHGITLRYTPDWFVRRPDAKPLCVEVKGPHVPPTFWQHARQRFVSAKAEWAGWFDFEMWQRNEGGAWNRIL